MFTGLITDLGEVLAVRPLGAGAVLRIRTHYDPASLAIGDSVAVNGVCLTVETLEGATFVATCGQETLRRTTLGELRAGDRVHLEQAMRLGDRLGGHMVQGHVDGVGRVRVSERAGESWIIRVEAPEELARFMVEKGSVTLDGVSLTINEIVGREFRVNIIPHTAEKTLLTGRRTSVNIEVDVLARYVDRLLGGLRPSLSMERLRELGFEKES